MPLPIPPTPLIGRAADIARAESYLAQADVRLLSLTGPPGVGKTRLALELARRAETDAADVSFVALESIRDSDLVPALIARTLGLRESAGQPLIAAIQAHLRERRALLILDNFEQVIAAAPLVADLLGSCPALQILITSRTPLHLRAELQLPLEPLALPNVEAMLGARATSADADATETIETSPAVQLFLVRARAVQPALAVTAANAAPIATICARLDGLPLAIELAAARAKLFSPREIAERLSRRLALLVDGSVDSPTRHQTLRAAIDWSYDLLSAEEQRILRLMAVFAGGGTLDAIALLTQPAGEERPSAPATDAPALAASLGALLDHSLIRRTEDGGGTSRFRMLETIREYAGEQLERAGEAEGARLQHAAYIVTLAEQANARLTGPEHPVWLDILEAEHDNVREALRWLLSNGRATNALELAATLWRFWWSRGYGVEGRRWLEQALRAGRTAPSGARGRALQALGALVSYQGDLGQATDALEEGLQRLVEAHDRRGAADALNFLGIIAFRQGNLDLAQQRYSEALRLWRELDERHGSAQALTNLGTVAHLQGDLSLAQQRYEEGLALYQELGEVFGVARVLSNLGNAVELQGDSVTARAHYERSLALRRSIGDRSSSYGNALTNLADLALDQRDFSTAHACYREALTLLIDQGSKIETATALAGLAALAAAQGDARTAARLYGAALALRQEIGAPWPAAQQASIDRRMAPAWAALGDAAYASEMSAGRTLPLQDAAALALTIEAEPAAVVAAPVPPARDATRMEGQAASRLTARETQVLRLLAGGGSNAEIASQLVLSERTVENHVIHIYRKIGARGRVDATAFAHRHGLAER